MGQPKRSTKRTGTGLRRSHLRLDLARRVNATSPVKVYTTAKQSGKKAKAAKNADQTAKASATKDTK